MGLDGAPPVALDTAGSYDFYPAWSPDGSTIAFSGPSLTLMNPDGSNLRRLTDIGTASPAWSRDGSRIAFTGIRSSTPETATTASTRARATIR